MPNPIICQWVVGGKTYHTYFCPACDNVHQMTIRPSLNSLGAGWSFDGNFENSTYEPSQLSTWGPRDNPRKNICHTFIRGGMIQYLGDCTHAMAGQTLPMPPVPDWLVQEAAERNAHPEGKAAHECD